MSRLVVVGDTLLDIDLVGTADRLCPDAPVPVVEIVDELTRPGGAGLAAHLAAADGVDVCLVTALADDEDGERLRTALADLPVHASRSPTPTPVKARVRTAGHPVTRFDRGCARSDAEVPVTDAMLDAVRHADAVLVSDYGRGLLANRRLRDVLTEVAARKPVVWDPHPRGAGPVPGVWLATPNLDEATAATGIGGTDIESAIQVAAALRAKWRSRAVVVTLGSRGALLDHGGAPIAVPTPDLAVTDPCGAGDRFAATSAAALMRGTSVDEAVGLAVHAAADFLARGGVSTIGAAPEDRSDAVSATAGLTGAMAVVARTRAAGGTVVATGGCFDLLHTGHLRTLRAARALGDCLVVCLNSDRSVRGLKGPDRPINHQEDRAELLASLSCVDAVAMFDSDTPVPLLSELRPDVWVKGGDYSVDALSEADTIRGWGGRTVVVPYHAGRSTTRLAEVLAEIG
jgi:rfaE bifunctional protein nucleotidyltransferase chain/domain/rfaE bifunctional protein kinase chain/domain